MKHKNGIIFSVILFPLLLSACDALNPALPTLAPGIVGTYAAMTVSAANSQTAAARPPATFTPTQPRPTRTATTPPTITATVRFILNTPTASLTPTSTIPPRPEEWPSWTSGEIVELKHGEAMGSSKFFKILQDVRVVVTRTNGVKLRDLPNKAIGGKQADKGSVLVLTGIMNLNRDYYPMWSFVQVKTGDGETYWVGGSMNTDTDPKRSLIFMYLLEPPTATISPTPLLFFFPTVTPTLTASPALTSTPTP